MFFINKKRLNGVLLFIVSCFLLPSCSNVQYNDEEHRSFPKDNKYELKDKQLSPPPNDIIDVNCIYTLEINGHFYYLRFWPDGHVCHRSIALNAIPTASDANSFYGCLMGFYILEGNKLKYELFIPEGWGKYVIYKGDIFGGNIHIKSLHGEKYPDREYKKTYVGKLTSKPDW